MGSLENILEINMAIVDQKNDRNSALRNIVETLFIKRDSFPDINSGMEDKKEVTNDSQHIGKNLLGKEEKSSYNPFKMISEYISMAKDKFYGYYSKIKDKVKDIVNKVGYTDKLLKEIEDWGVIYFKTAFRKLTRLTPLGIMQRYLEELWIYVAKKIK